MLAKPYPLSTSSRLFDRMDAEPKGLKKSHKEGYEDAYRKYKSPSVFANRIGLNKVFDYRFNHVSLFETQKIMKVSNIVIYGCNWKRN